MLRFFKGYGVKEYYMYDRLILTENWDSSPVLEGRLYP
jgi:hypothetical protein